MRVQAALRWLHLWILAGFLLATPGAALEVPAQPQGRVSDYAGLLSPGQRAQIDERLAAIEAANSNQFAVAIFPSLEGESLEDFSIRLAEAWKMGHSGRDNGLLLLIFVQDRKVRIEVGYGLEGAITDALSGRIIRDALAPRFRQGDYAAGIEAAITALDQASRGEFTALPQRSRRSSRSPSVAFPFLLLIVLLGFMSSLRRRSALLGGRRRHLGGIWWIGPWGGFGRRGGGGFGGFGGGGGFSGGGGGFGGGGASGGW